jgi:hypothetical protein
MYPSSLVRVAFVIVGCHVTVATQAVAQGRGAAAVDASLRWLALHQEADGHWSADGFSRHCPEDGACAGAGAKGHEVFVTSLALLAFLSAGSTTADGPHQDAVAKAVAWLRARQDRDGLVGSRSQATFMHGHALATLALSEALVLADVELRASVQKAVEFALAARNRGGAWSRQPGGGDDVASVSCWMTLALASALKARIEVPESEEVWKELIHWLDSAADPQTGLFTVLPASRPDRHHQEAPPATARALCAAGLLSRFLLGQDPKTTNLMWNAARTLRESQAALAAAGHPVDPSLRFLGSFAMFYMGGADWQTWSKDVVAPLRSTQRKDGHLAGSWDPTGAWSGDGGRIYVTAMNVLTLTVYYRNLRILAPRSLGRQR